MKILLRHRTLSKDFFLFAGFVVVVVALFSVWFSWQFYQDQSSRILSDLEAKALRIQSTIKDDIDYVSYQMEFLGNQIAYGDPKDLDFVYKTLSYSKTNHKVNISTTWNMFSWVNKNFLLVADGEAGVIETPKDMTIRDYIPHTVETPWKFHLGKPVHGAVSRQWIIPGGMGYTNSKGEYIGAVVFGFAIDSMVTKLENSIKANGVSFAILDKKLNVIAESRDNKQIKADGLIIQRLKEIYTDHKLGIVSKQSLLSNNESYAYFYSLDKYPFIIVTSYDKVLAKSEMINGIFSRVVEFALLALLIMALLWLLRKTTINPITELSNIANDIASGNTNKIKLPRSSSYEVNNLIKHLLDIRKFVRKERLTNARIEELVKIHKDADKEKEEFLRDMYHTLNTPLNAVINGADIARNELLGPLDIKTYGRYFEAMYDAGMQLKCFTTEFLYPELIDISEIIEKCVKIQRRYAHDKGCELIYNATDEIPEIWADRLRLRQVILSVLYHSMFYTTKGKQSTITTQVENLTDGNPACLTIKVEDNGWGPDEKEREEDWQELFGIDETESFSRNPDMMKLSLSTIRHMVDLHHGSFETEGKAGSGSTFTIRLPYMKKENLLMHPDDFMKLRNNKKDDDGTKQNIINFPDRKK